MTYRPAFVTQRDGSPLASSNCRCASIAMGIDAETRGADTSTGAKMRSYMDDQSGGTDSGDARQAWSRGYDASLTIRDGETFDRALDDLKDNRAVHLDVWHASVGGPCLSSSGSYGHTMIVLPDYTSAGYLVGDPWCTDGYHRVTTSKLRAGAERWGSEVYGRAAEEPDWPTGGADPRSELVRAIVRRIVKRLMSEAYPDGPPGELRHPETAGGAILYTVTHAIEADDMGTPFEITGSPIIGKATTTKPISLIPTEGGDFVALDVGTVRNVFALTTISGGTYDGSAAYLCQIPDGSEHTGLLLASAATYVPTPEPGGDGDVDEAVAARDAEWAAWLLEGSPGS